MPFWDDLSMFTWGGLPWTNKVFCVIGGVAGAGIGGWLGYDTGGVWAGLTGAASGGVLGFGAGFLLSGVFLFLLIFLVILLVGFGWEWMTGALGP